MMRSVVSENIGMPAQKIAPSFPTGSNGRPSDENATACGGWVWTTAAMSDRARKISGMDEDLAMARHGAADPLALAIDGDDVVGRHLLEADAGGLHQKTPVAIGQTQCHVPCDIIALVFADEHAARLDEFFAQSIGHVVTLFRALPLWPPAAIPTLHPTRAPA